MPKIYPPHKPKPLFRMFSAPLTSKYPKLRIRDHQRPVTKPESDAKPQALA